MIKSEAELEVLRYVNRVSSAGHVEVKSIQKGRSTCCQAMNWRKEGGWFLCYEVSDCLGLMPFTFCCYNFTKMS